MTLPFIQGFLATLTLDTNDITLSVTDVSLGESKTSLDKSVMDGFGESASIPGKLSGTLSISGHVEQGDLNLLQATWAKPHAVAFELLIEEGLATDSSWVGTIMLTSFNKATAADGNWSFTLAGDVFGVTFTPSIP